MVRLNSRSLLHLTPEFVDIEVDLPFYASVREIGQDNVTSRGFVPEEGNVDRGVSDDLVVRATEVNRSRKSSLLRRPVSVNIADQVHYGQVAGVFDDELMIQSGGHQFVAQMLAVSVVAPVVAVLLEHTEFNSDEWSSGDIKDLEELIVSQVIWHGGIAISNEVSVILVGLIDTKSYPESKKLCRRVDPKSGEETQFPLQHALDFTYYVE
ncbi:hypothetical protein JG688_00007124 [Phytophthora aleatoria]|uniref:Uncharacterized protein n=1 Tax=Phytophthora aleatoria TaxID=2496075 RepID=A0A8J5J8D6_9STRA|nr:hypothetical protein JG688_00007124 [Phytophthora aleatoria]